MSVLVGIGNSDSRQVLKKLQEKWSKLRLEDLTSVMASRASKCCVARAMLHVLNLS